MKKFQKEVTKDKDVKVQLDALCEKIPAGEVKVEDLYITELRSNKEHYHPLQPKEKVAHA